MAKRKWKGKLTKNIRNYGDALAGKEYTFKKGQEVIVWKKRVYDDKYCWTGKYGWTGKYEYHYSDADDKGLCRTSEFLIEE